ncbi:hypothetical protein JSO02_002981 [Listeria innocua]|nr:hypothetical protein [Listeria innocua]EHF3650189.1 hypothetical protein [Listeria innocua]EHF3659370.1 hypothetical protein [Listeria innocua]EHF3662566.1 hypothetical protein [Listeria innocua]
MNDDEILKILLKFADFFSINSFAKDVFRDIFIWLIKGLVTINGVMENVFFYSVKLISWPTTKAMETLINDPKKGLVIIAVTLMGLTLMFIGGKIILGDRMSPQEFTRNFIMVTLVLIGLTGFMGSLEKLTFAGVDVGKNAFSSEENSKISYQIVKDNITDLKALDADGWKTTTPKKANYLNEDSWKTVNFNEVIDEQFKHAEGLAKKRVDQDDSGQNIVEDLDSSFWMPSTDDYYYRYHVGFTAIIIQEIFILLVFAFSTLIIVETSFELGVKGVIGPFIAASDMATGQRIKNLLIDLIGAYVKIVVLVFIIQLYRLFMNWTQSIHFSDSLVETTVLKCLIVVGAFFAVLKGSSSVQRLLGIDVSQSFGQQALMGTMAGAQIMKGAGGLASGLTKGTAKQFGKNGFIGKRAQSLSNKRQEKAKKQALTETLGGKENYKEKMNPRRQAQREGFNEAQQVLATEQAMNQQQSTGANSNNVGSNKNNSGSSNKNTLSSNSIDNKGNNPTSPGNKGTNSTTPTNSQRKDNHVNDANTKKGSNAVNRLNQQKANKSDSSKQNVPLGKQYSKYTSNSSNNTTKSNLNKTESQGQKQYSTKVNRDSPKNAKPASKMVPKKPQKTQVNAKSSIKGKETKPTN